MPRSRSSVTLFPIHANTQQNENRQHEAVLSSLLGKINFLENFLKETAKYELPERISTNELGHSFKQIDYYIACYLRDYIFDANSFTEMKKQAFNHLATERGIERLATVIHLVVNGTCNNANRTGIYNSDSLTGFDKVYAEWLKLPACKGVLKYFKTVETYADVDGVINRAIDGIRDLTANQILPETSKQIIMGLR